MTPQQLAPLIAIAIVLPLVLLRNRRPRVLRPDRMWILPAIFVPFIAFGLWGMHQGPLADLSPYAALDWVVLAIALGLGVVAGWWRGRMITIHKDGDDVLKAQASPLGLVILVALLLGRQALRPWLEDHAGAFGLNITAIEQAFLVFVIGLILVQRLEMFLRARTVMAGGKDAHLALDT
ncbi:DUF1453 domain-containing protein [uncultured Brevundimonas sp.]|uniref:DUF1453 domain-containing protein n=1 Tax=uncultured Brevundimonas sp. TaxID=213418 RepID=UPI0030EDC88C|tara:strand:+ start:1203 stop:1739 length:537 start_codon:yes stop_codon:yes gene_type:complete